jgi:hypothetical protein
VAVAYAGTGAMRSYIGTLSHLNQNIALVEEKRHLLLSLSAFFDVLLPAPRLALAAYVAFALLVWAAAWRVWKSAAPLGLRYSMLLVATALTSPHFYVYDLLILTPAMFLTADWLLRQESSHGRILFSCVALLYIVPLVGPVTARTLHIQTATPLMGVLSFAIARGALQAPKDHRIDTVEAAGR